jgi:hypothetical protein
MTSCNTTITLSYAWDFENRSTSVTSSPSTVLATYKYDPFERRIQKVVGTTFVNYDYYGDSIIEELNDSGTLFLKISLIRQPTDIALPEKATRRSQIEEARKKNKFLSQASSSARYLWFD